MPFGNPILGGTTLIRPAIQSPNYVTGSTGWMVKKDGSAEFNNVVVRGTLAVGSIGPGIAIPGGQVTGTVPNATSSGTVTGSIGAGVQVPASQLDATQIPTTTLINGGSITTGTVDAARIAARSITADKVVIGDTSNIILDPDFSQNSTAWNFVASIIRLASTDPSVPVNAPAPFVTKIVNQTFNSDLTWKHTTFTPNFLMPVSPGETYYVEAWVCASTDSNATLRFFLRTTDAAGGTASFPSIASTAPTAAQAWTKISGLITIPAGKFRAAFGIGSIGTTTPVGSWFVTNLKMRKAVEGSLVVNGGITAQQIDATNLNVAAANITGKLTAGQIDATGLQVTNGVVSVKDASGSTTVLSGNTSTGGVLANHPGLSGQLIRNTGDPATVGAIDPGGPLPVDMGLLLTSPSSVVGGLPGTDFAQIQMTGNYIGAGTQISANATLINFNDLTVMNGTGVITDYGGGYNTYTPVVAGGGTATFTTRTGWWQRFGSTIHFCAYIVVGTAGSGTTVIQVNAPTNIYRVTRQTISAHVSVSTAIGTGEYSALCFTSGTGATIDRITRGGANLTGADLNAGALITIQGTYREV